jgi:hypothetical protein
VRAAEQDLFHDGKRDVLGCNDKTCKRSEQNRKKIDPESLSKLISISQRLHESQGDRAEVFWMAKKICFVCGAGEGGGATFRGTYQME